MCYHNYLKFKFNLYSILTGFDGEWLFAGQHIVIIHNNNGHGVYRVRWQSADEDMRATRSFHKDGSLHTITETTRTLGKVHIDFKAVIVVERWDWDADPDAGWLDADGGWRDFQCWAFC